MPTIDTCTYMRVPTIDMCSYMHDIVYVQIATIDICAYMHCLHMTDALHTRRLTYMRATPQTCVP